ncbi:MAG: ArdC-like ssDNA-binding domain-containing protein [Thermoleophilia bacterium]
MTPGGRRSRPGAEAAARQAEARREQARAQLEAASEELRSSEGWQRFARARALLRGYSLNNTLLILAQRPDATTVASFRHWTELGREVRRGERALRIWAPSLRRERDEATGEEKATVRAFVLVPVFDISQTDGPPLPEPPPVRPLTGDSHAHLLSALERQAADAAYAVERHDAMPGGADGFVDHRRRVIALSAGLAPNGQVAVLVHELAHVHGARYAEFGRAGAEVVAETAAFVALSAARLDTSGQAIPYVAGWADAAPKEISGYAEAVHRIARVLERGLGLEVGLRERSAVEVAEPRRLARSWADERKGHVGRVR